jgi:hypothetical protein
MSRTRIVAVALGAVALYFIASGIKEGDAIGGGIGVFWGSIFAGIAWLLSGLSRDRRDAK